MRILLTKSRPELAVGSHEFSPLIENREFVFSALAGEPQPSAPVLRGPFRPKRFDVVLLPEREVNGPALRFHIRERVRDRPPLTYLDCVERDLGDVV